MSTATVPSEARLLLPKLQVAFILGGNATFTLRSQKTGARFTYNVKKVCCPSCKKSWAYGGASPRTSCKTCQCHLGANKFFVSLLSGSDNERDYTYLGMLVPSDKDGVPYVFMTTKRSRVGTDAPSYLAFTWTIAKLMTGAEPEGVEIWHAGKCGICGRKLTVPTSIAIGIGPDCLEGM